MMGDQSEHSQDEGLNNDHTTTKLMGKDGQPTVTMENVMNALGVPGRYQVFHIFCSCVCMLPFSFAMLNFVFIGFEPPHTCQAINDTEFLAQYDLMNDSTAMVNYGSCSISLTSNRTGREETIVSQSCLGGYNFTGGKYVSMVTEWDLVCDKRGIVQLVQSLFTVGMALGSVFYTSLGDRYGRKKMYALSSAMTLLMELAIVFAPNIYAVIALRFVSGTAVIGMYYTHFIPCVELVVSRYRQIVALGHVILWSTSVMFMAGIAFLFRNNKWWYFQLACPVLCIPIFIFIFFIDETPSWYFAKGRYKDAKRALCKACKMNGKDNETVQNLFAQVVKNARTNQQEEASKDLSESEADYTILDLLRNKQLFISLVILAAAWFTNSLTYYGLYLTSSAIAGNRFLNFFLMAALEIPSSLLCLQILRWIGRRTTILIFLFMSGVCLTVSTILTVTEKNDVHGANASTAFFLLGKFAIGSCFSMVFTYTPEIFPTTIRSSGIGVCSAFARVGGAIAPFMLPLFLIVPWAPGTILSALCFLCITVVRLLPETRGKQLPITIEDFIRLKKNTT